MAEFQHKSVMVNECIEALRPALAGNNKVFVDATLGLGGHTEEVVRTFPGVHVIAIDRDEEALRLSKDRLSGWENRIEFVHGDFADIDSVLHLAAMDGIDGILFDLGVSSMQLDDDARGFSYHQDSKLDMRMNIHQERSAFEVINGSSQEDLETILREYGEEKYAKKIAAAIVEKRPIDTTLELVDVIKNALPAYVLRKTGHPARKTFQAIRIEVNQELQQLRIALASAAKKLNPNGRIVVLTYHSLEDRIVKNFFRTLCSDSQPIDLPFPPSVSPYFLVCPGGLEPSEKEVEENSRSRSARLRVLASREMAA
ncbi:MAG: 16S rRNA (cytosine(1402)-N(4))-methyltransferase RsmH [Candidatus Nanopelagicales bacterium]